MNKNFTVIAFSVVLCSCMGKHSSNAQKATVTKQNTQFAHQASDTISIDIEKSKLHWKGTKMRGVGKHEGKIELKSGYFMTKDKLLVDGSFIVAMSTIAVTDIPEHEVIPRKNLNEHLKSSDFFDAKNFPIAKFQISNVEQITTDSLQVSGGLTLKDSTKHIAFGARYQNGIFTTQFTIDRFQWNIAYTGNLADRTFVDQDIELKIELRTH